jgi:hypothetical protein
MLVQASVWEATTCLDALQRNHILKGTRTVHVVALFTKLALPRVWDVLTANTFVSILGSAKNVRTLHLHTYHGANNIIAVPSTVTALPVFFLTNLALSHQELHVVSVYLGRAKPIMGMLCIYLRPHLNTLYNICSLVAET